MSAKAEYEVMTGDEVVILAGEHRERTAKVVRFVNDNDRVELEVDGLEDEDKVIKHQRRSHSGDHGCSCADDQVLEGARTARAVSGSGRQQRHAQWARGGSATRTL